MDGYSIKDIIMSTRKEYLIIEKYLLELKKLTLHDKNVRDFYYVLTKFKYVFEKPEVQCKVYPNPLTLKGLKHYLNLKLFCNVPEIASYISCYKNNNDNYIVRDNYHNFMIKKQKEFKRIVELILSSQFANSIKYNINYQNGIITFDVTPRNIGGIFNINDKNKIYYNYLSKNDSLEFNSNNAHITEQIIWQILNYKIPAELLSSYHIELIENSVPELKNVSLKLDNEKSKKLKLLVKENKGNIILK